MKFIARTVLGAAVVAAVTATAAPALAAPSGPTAPPSAAPVTEPVTERVSVAPDGAQADGSSSDPAVSADGTVVAFVSDAANLVPGDTPGTRDVFVRDGADGTLLRVTDGAGSPSSPALSPAGHHLTYTTYDPAAAGSYALRVYDLRTGVTETLAPTLDDGYAASYGAAVISEDGRTVAFDARPTGATLPGAADGSRVYVLDRETGTAERISHSPDSTNGARGCTVGSISADGTKVAYQDAYTNGPRDDDWGDILVHDRTTGGTTHADATYDGTAADKASTEPLLSADGSTVVFNSYATDLVPGTDPNRGWNPFVRDLRTGTLTRVDGADPASVTAATGISADGSKLLYSAYAAGVEGHWVRDLADGGDTLATPRADGSPQGVGSSALSADGATVVFAGYDDGAFVPGDTNGEQDVFVRRLR
ncbi:TolB family protein [Streptomyces sp. NPDC057137]|uniref:TolB family protein n=1 Tax=Streptomyces sp. NPDC057137 TaxID=3346030 RepID=UPI00362541EA